MREKELRLRAIKNVTGLTPEEFNSLSVSERLTLIDSNILELNMELNRLKEQENKHFDCFGNNFGVNVDAEQQVNKVMFKLIVTSIINDICNELKIEINTTKLVQISLDNFSTADDIIKLGVEEIKEKVMLIPK